MITAVCFLILVASVPLAGGELWRLGTIRLRQWWMILASLAVQVVITSGFDWLPEAIGAALHLFSYALAIGFVLFNRHVVGMGIIVLGGMLNLAAIAANDGVMPARLEALQTAGIITDSTEFENSAPIEDAKLWFLGDVFAIPDGVPFANVFSVGDVLLVIGGGITVHMVGRSRLARRWLSSDETAEDAVDVAVDQAPAAAAEHPGEEAIPVKATSDMPAPLVELAPTGATHARWAPDRPSRFDHLFQRDLKPIVHDKTAADESAPELALV